MSEETKTDKQLLLAEHKKANDALRAIKSRAEQSVVTTIGATLGNMYELTDVHFSVLSNYLRIQFERIMKSNNKKQTSTFKPIRTKHLDTNKEPKMAATKKKPAAKPAKKVSKKTTAKKTATKRK